MTTPKMAKIKKEDPYLSSFPSEEGQYSFNLKNTSDKCPVCAEPLTWYRAWYPKKTLRLRCSNENCNSRRKGAK